MSRGILKVDHGPAYPQDDEKNSSWTSARMRVVFYAEPISLEEAQNLKREPGDSESVEARWVTREEISGLKPCLRRKDLVFWSKYLEEGGEVFPLRLFTAKEGTILDPKTDRSEALTMFPQSNSTKETYNVKNTMQDDVKSPIFVTNRRQLCSLF